MSERSVLIESVPACAAYIFQDFLDWQESILGSSDHQIEELNMKDLLSDDGSLSIEE